jgi:deazaflavin-dependent oxidoreductase (nitroreductase family)
MPNDLVLKTVNSVHQLVTKLSFGKLGWSLGKMPVVELTTIGRKTGQERTVMLTSPLTVDGAIVVVASKGGDDRNPAWFTNLQFNPSVVVKVGGGPKRPMTARVASDDERAGLWPQVTAAYKGYADYQTKTQRQIPLVLLEATSG